MTDKYYIYARLFPAVLTSIPLLILLNVIVADFYNESLREYFQYLPLITNASLSAGIVFLFVQINRLISKEIFQRFFFQEEIKMPTTNHLLWEDVFFDDRIKTQIRKKIESVVKKIYF